jgi:PAS domain S-box-containing protein
MPSLDDLGVEVETALESINVPSYMIDATGVVRWLNPAAKKLVGDVRGRQFTSVVAPEDRRRARDVFAQKVVGTADVTDAEVVLMRDDGERVAVDVSSVPLREGNRIIGVFGQMTHEPEQMPISHPDLTPRQTEVLRLLGSGRSTKQIAAELHLSRDTVRNHVRHLLRALDVNSRLEAVAVARREHLVSG